MAGLLSLRTLDLSNNNISSISNSFFYSMHKLEELDLSKNQLEGISLSVFHGLNDLEYLDISSNRQHLHIFRKMRNLRDL